MKATKENVLGIIDEVMNNREIDSIRNAILAIRDKVKDLEEVGKYDDSTNTLTIDDAVFVKIRLRGDNPLNIGADFEEGDKYVIIDSHFKIDTGIYGNMWYE